MTPKERQGNFDKKTDSTVYIFLAKNGQIRRNVELTGFQLPGSQMLIPLE